MRKIKAQGLKKIPQTTDNTQQTQRRWETREVGIGNAECGMKKNGRWEKIEVEKLGWCEGGKRWKAER
jgi:hypothetical protein